MNNSENPESTLTDSPEKKPNSILFKIVDIMMKIRSKIRESQPDFYEEFNL